MAKGLEDTSFYRYHPLMSLNDVGGNPLEFGLTPLEFHSKTAIRTEHWPHSMLTTSTHDSKLSEDARARINVLSELPAEWRLKVRQWRALNQNKKLILDGTEAPSRNDEYLFYQVLIGIWPANERSPGGNLRERLTDYMLKAAREAKELTSWANQNSEYESALNSFVNAVLDPAASQDFLTDFAEFHRRIAQCGMMNSLSQTLIKLTAPGVPDIYQGNELYEFQLVDPDNRRPVDYVLRRDLFKDLSTLSSSKSQETARTLVENLQQGNGSGRAKLYLTWRALQARQQNSRLFQSGNYVPLYAEGRAAKFVFAFGPEGGNYSSYLFRAPFPPHTTDISSPEQTSVSLSLSSATFDGLRD